MNNPVMLADENGDLPKWAKTFISVAASALVVAGITAIVVATGGTAASVLVPVAISVGTTTYKDLADDGRLNTDIAAYCGAAIGSSVGALGGNFISNMFFSGAGDLITDIFSGNVQDFKDGAISFVTGSFFGSVGYGVSKSGDYISKRKIDGVVGNWNKDNHIINKKLSTAGLRKYKIGKLGGRQGIYDAYCYDQGLMKMQRHLKNIFDLIIGVSI